MSGDEVIVLLLSGLLGPLGWILAFARLARVDGTGRRAVARRTLGVVFAACSVGLLLVLWKLASHDVRDSAAYLLLYLALGMAWMRVAIALMPWLGLSLRDDVIERGNAAALPAVAGWLGGTLLAFAGGNVGDGPGWWVVVGCALLASSALAVAWLLLDALARVGDAVAVERDIASGWRLGGFLVAGGLIAGRAVAGDWVSTQATLHDFVRVGWPLVLLLALAAAVQRAAGPRPSHEPSVARHGVAPALGYVAFAVVVVVAAGWPP